ncbi:hypothetical protein M9435_006085 [Picochlorum sp. BPE23]|nr:hypothetical protein M9435_006085 [Picochlorum sp. BPE23]
MEVSQLTWPQIGVCVAALYALKVFMDFVCANCDLNLFSKRKKPPLGYFSGKVVWIVGASQGLGKSLAVRWAQDGARVILSSRRETSLMSVKRECCVFVGEDDVAVLPFDITDSYARIEKVAEEAFAAFGHVDYIVYNAGASQHGPVEETSHEVAEMLLRMNVMGQMAVARASLPYMLERQAGHHVVIASMASAVPSPGQAVYAAAKSAVKAYFLSMATELSSRGIEVTVVNPGPIDVGENARPRMVFGKDGLMEQKNTSASSKRVSIDTVTELVLRAVYHKVSDCWITRHPVLFMGYLMQVVPRAALVLLKKVGPGRVTQLDKGTGTGYDVAAMLQKRT